ncbi:MAG: potassium channel protein [Calditrichaeota bacterium]|nr:MAG: potassium channel protein [Calditrichota bacterium]
MINPIVNRVYTRFFFAFGILISIILIGTFGYYYIDDARFTLLECFYMTMITISTIGYGEVVEVQTTSARLFTIFIAFSGIGGFTYILSNITALVIDGEIKNTFRKIKMEKKIEKLHGHFIICGDNKIGEHIAKELDNTKRPFVVVDVSDEKLKVFIERHPDGCYIKGDATQNSVLEDAGVENAYGLFASTGNDNQNLVICLTAKHLNPNLKIISSCDNLEYDPKLRQAGADGVITPKFIGGLRMASEMIRPTVVSFLDTMLRDQDKNLRIEEIVIKDKFIGKEIREIGLRDFPATLVLALKRDSNWLYNPLREQKLKKGDTLVVMTNPEERVELEKYFEI